MKCSTSVMHVPEESNQNKFQDFLVCVVQFQMTIELEMDAVT